MTTYQFLLFLFTLTFPAASLDAGSYRAHPPADTLPKEADHLRLEQIEQKLTRSPHYKNRNAAGRLAIFNRTAPAARASARKRLTGPAYKNRKPASASPDNMTRSVLTMPRLMGPRYKNRGASIHRKRQYRKFN